MARYLYGARPDDRYYSAFNREYGDLGEEIHSEITDQLSNLNKHNNLAKVMEKGRDKAYDLADKQARSFGMNIEDFTDKYNKLLENFELLAYRSLEYTSTDISHRLTAEVRKIEVKSNNRTLEENLEKVAGEVKVLEKIGDAGGQAVSDFWQSIIGDTKDDLKELLPDLVEARSKDFIERNAQYGARYAGLMGEGAAYIFAKAMIHGKGNVLNTLQQELRNKNLKVEMTGAKGGKGDLKIGDMVFSIKNYTALRKRFTDFSENEVDNETLEAKAVDISIQSTGLLETVIENFQKDTKNNVLPENFYTYVMNALYFNEYKGEFSDDSLNIYQEAMRILDILVNVYAYTFLAQGTSKNLGYGIDELVSNKRALPGFMWFTGKGIVPIYKVLDSILKGFETVLKRVRHQKGSAIYARIKIQGAAAGVSAVDQQRTRGPVYGEHQSVSKTGWYKKSFNSTTAKNQDVPPILMGRYSRFSRHISTSVKLHIQLNALNKLIETGSIS